jgi:hypothetical protein
MSKLHFISDVHTEHFKGEITLENSCPKIEAPGDCVALLGDIGNPW